MIKDWKEKSLFLRIIAIINIIVSIMVIIFVVLSLLGVFDNIYYFPLLGISMFIQVIENWKENRGIAYASLSIGIMYLITILFVFGG